MNMSESTIKGVGALVLLGVIAAGSFLVVKPQLEEALSLQSQTTDMKTQTDLRSDRLNLVQVRANEFDTIAEDVDNLLSRITPDKFVTNIAAAVVNALNEDVRLTSFTHGELDPSQPNFTAPKVTIEDLPLPFDVSAAPSGGGASSSESPSGDEEAEGAPPSGLASSENPANPGQNSAAVPRLAGAPFVLTVDANSYSALMNYVNSLQVQQRVITVLSVVASTEGDGGVSGTIYAYAFAGSSPAIQEWVKTRGFTADGVDSAAL